MSLFKLRLSIVGTLALIIGISTLFFTVILSLIGSFSLLTLAAFVIIFNLIQWLIAPYLIDAMYKVKEVPKSDTKLHGMVQRISERQNLKAPRFMIADMPLPNAFAYGSPIAGNRVAVTTGLLKELEDEEVEAVLGHELGHLKHRDVQVMMFASVLPAIFYFVGYSFLISSMYGGSRREGGGGSALIGIAALAIYFVLTLFVLGLSRLREYYADQESARTVDDGARKLSEGLAKIVNSSSKLKMSRRRNAKPTPSAFKALFIEDPDRAVDHAVTMAQEGLFSSDRRLVEKIMRRKVTTGDRITEMLSTHPNIVKRLRALQQIS